MKKLRRVSPEDFDVNALIAAAREGRLYVDDSCERVGEDIVINNVRAYVRRINQMVTPQFRTRIDDVWNDILACEGFVKLLTPGSKTKKCREFDKYNLMRIIGVLREKDVYERYSDLKYNALLEQTDKDTPYRRYLGMGLEQRGLIVKIREIVARYHF